MPNKLAVRVRTDDSHVLVASRIEGSAGVARMHAAQGGGNEHDASRRYASLITRSTATEFIAALPSRHDSQADPECGKGARLSENRQRPPVERGKRQPQIVSPTSPRVPAPVSPLPLLSVKSGATLSDVTT